MVAAMSVPEQTAGMAQMRLVGVGACPICGCHDRSVIYPATFVLGQLADPNFEPHSAHYDIARCVKCGLMLSDPVLPSEYVQYLYEKARRTNVPAGEEENVRATMRHYYDMLRPYLARKERMLDVGCDTGVLLEIAGGDGFKQLDGLEPNPLARRQAASRCAARIADGFYEQTDYPADFFDLITFIHVLDHVEDPARVLRRAYGQLSAGGILFAVVHNIESFLGRIMGKRFPVLNLYHHYFFSKSTLRALCESVGLGVETVVGTRNCYSSRHLARHLPGLLRQPVLTGLRALGLGAMTLTLPLGNIAVVARRPLAAPSARGERHV
jgi:SAM-dependent methyltransferase